MSGPRYPTLSTPKRRARYASRQDPGPSVPVYFTRDEFERLQEVADRQGITATGFVKRCTMAAVSTWEMYAEEDGQ